MNHHIAKRGDQVLKRGDIVVSMQTARNLTFAYVTDNGDIATQELGRDVVIHPTNRLVGVAVTLEPPERKPIP